MSIDDSFPTPSPEDSDDVELALETAGALWNKGDRPEALRWVRRAAEAAEQAGDDRRALELARRAAELDAAPEPVPAPEPAIEQPKAEEPAVEEPVVEEEARAEAPPTTVAPPPSVTSPPAKPSVPVASVAPEARVSQPPPKPSERASVTPVQPQRPPETSRREPVRVYVKTSARDQSLLIVRPLEAGRRAPFGTREAMLVFEEPS